MVNMKVFAPLRFMPGVRIGSSSATAVPEENHRLEVAARADRVVSRVRTVDGNVLIFSSGHFIRVLAVRWIGLESSVTCSYFMLSTASLSALGYKRDLSHPAIWLWNDDHHVGD